MSRKPTSLADALAKKTSLATPAAPEPVEPPVSKGPVVTLTLRLPPEVHEQLRELAFVERTKQHTLLLEGLNMLFEKRGKPPIAL